MLSSCFSVQNSRARVKAHRLLPVHAVSPGVASPLPLKAQLCLCWYLSPSELNLSLDLTRRPTYFSCCFLQDLLGRWSVLPILAVACCVWNKWKANQLEGKLEQAKLEEVCSAHACAKTN